MGEDDLLDYFIQITDDRFTKFDERLDSIDEKLDELLIFKWTLLGGAAVVSVIASFLIDLLMK